VNDSSNHGEMIQTSQITFTIQPLWTTHSLFLPRSSSPFDSDSIDGFKNKKADKTGVETQSINQGEHQKARGLASMHQPFGPNMRFSELKGMLFTIRRYLTSQEQLDLSSRQARQYTALP
jgi:hypothetical protein